jgi:hypothetical protein
MEDELKSRTFNYVIDHYLNTGTLSPEAYAGLTDRQKDVVQVIKRAFKRMKYGRDNEGEAE